MSTSNTQRESTPIKQRIFIAALAIVGVLLSALVLYYFSPRRATSEALPYQHLSPVVCQGSVQA